MKALGYVRVSRVGKREGDSFLSPELQRESIDRVCQRERLELVEVLEELDRSGGDAARPLWNQAIERVERGEVGAIVVWNLDRFSRSLIDALDALDRIEKASGRLYSEEGAAGKLERSILFAVAEHQRDKIRDNFRRADASAIERGIHIASRVPTGYSRDLETRRLVPNEFAPLIVGLFERRAKGWGWQRLAQWFVEQGGSPKTNAQAVRWMIRNPAYLGHAYSGDLVNKRAHPAIVTRLLYDRANAVSGRAPNHDGSLSSQLLLTGLVRCAGCGYAMSVSSSSSTVDGKRRTVASYRCNHEHCRARASIRGIELDPFVIRTLFKLLRLVGTTGVRVPGTTAMELTQAREALAAAEYDRQKLVENRELRRLLTAEEYNRELVAVAEAAEEARLALEMAESDHEAPRVENIERVWEEWTPETRREWLREMVEVVEVTSARRRRNILLYERVRMGFRGLDEPILERTEEDIADRKRRYAQFRRRLAGNRADT
jgi:site-specific DNA recombinase